MKLKKATITLLRQVKKKILSKPKSFDMDTWASPNSSAECGTTGCIAGWVVMLTHPDLQDQVKKSEDRLIDWESRATVELGISVNQASALFHEDNWPKRYRDKVHASFSDKEDARIAANRIEHFIRTGE